MHLDMSVLKKSLSEEVCSLVVFEALVGQSHDKPPSLIFLFYSPWKRMLGSSIISFPPLPSLFSIHPSLLKQSLEANRGPHFCLLIGCLTGQCLKAINGEKHFCPVLSIGLQEKRLPRVWFCVSQNTAVLFSFSHVTTYSFNSALQNSCRANYLCVWKMGSAPSTLPSSNARL